MTTIPAIQKPPQTPAATSKNAREELANHIYTVTAALEGAAALSLLVTYISQPVWQILVLAAVFLIAAILHFFLNSASIPLFKSHERRVLIYNLIVYISLGSVASLISGVGIFAGALILVLTLLIPTALLEKPVNALFIGIFFDLIVNLIGTSAFLPQLTISYPPPAYIVIIAFLGLVFLTAIGMMTLRFISTSLGIKLIVVSLVISLVPLFITSAIQSNFASGALRDQTNQALDLAANQTATNVDEFLQTNQQLILKEAELPVFISYLSLAPSKRKNSQEEQELKLTLESIVAQSGEYLSSFGLINIDGKNVFDSNPLEIGNDEEREEYFVRTVLTRQVYVSPILFAKNDDPYIYFTAPIRNDQQQIIGILRARFDGLILQSLIEQTRNHIGVRSYPILLDDNNIRIADTLTPNFLYKSITPLANDTLNNLVASKRLPNKPTDTFATNLTEYLAAIENVSTEKYFSTPAMPGDTAHLMFGTAVTLTNQPWKVVYLKEQSELKSLLTAQQNSASSTAVVIALIIALLATFFGASISRPIIQLKSTADRISTGDLSAAAIIQTGDEIGSLGNAFNLMTQRLRESIYELEDRVQERTAAIASQNLELQSRSQQLLTVSDVAREIATTQELEPLLDEVTRLISERFNFYHVGIFLIDNKREFAYLRAANSEGGKRMLARSHKLKVGQVGMVGFVTGTGVPRISTDVGKDAVFFNNPDLPLTRSEMALPLKVGKNVIGALDVQSVKSDAFSEEDIKLFTTLADQVAIAIQNNSLYTQTTNALQEAQSLHRQYLNQEWQRETTRRQHSGYIFTTKGIVPADDELAPNIEQALRTGTITISEGAQAGTATGSTMVLPIKLRGEPIGVIHLQQTDQSDRKWSENEIATVQSVADQVAQALENARLFEQTVRRAERERRALDITNKIRATNDPQAMLEIAVKELQAALGTSRAQIYIQGDTQEAAKPEVNIEIKNNGSNPQSLDEANER